MLAHLVDRHDVRVIEIRGGLGFGTKALDKLLGGQRASHNRLHCDHAVQTPLSRLEDDAHSAAGDFLEELVVTVTEDPNRTAAVAQARPGGSHDVTQLLIAWRQGDWKVAKAWLFNYLKAPNAPATS
jgi:hypothetical protein